MGATDWQGSLWFYVPVSRPWVLIHDDGKPGEEGGEQQQQQQQL